MGGELKEKVAQGVAWSMAEKIGSMLLAMAVRLVILRLLTRDILGFMSIPSAVVTVLLVIVDSGFSQSLVRHKGPSQSDYKSVFLFNIAVSAVLYGVLVALAPLAARWYGMPEIARIAPVFFLLLTSIKRIAERAGKIFVNGDPQGLGSFVYLLHRHAAGDDTYTGYGQAGHIRMIGAGFASAFHMPESRIFGMAVLHLFRPGRLRAVQNAVGCGNGVTQKLQVPGGQRF